MANTYYIGIDPGKNGGVAILDSSLNLVTHRCPKSEQEMANIIRKYEYDDAYVVIEKVHSFPGQGVVSTFSFGQNFGTWIGILEAFSLPYIFANPKQWMKTYQPLSKIKKERKHELKDAAQSLHPEEKITLITSDAVLLAHYCYNWEVIGE